MLVIRCFVLETATRLHGKREVGDHINVDQHDYIFALPCEDVNFSTHAYRPVLQGYKNIYLLVTLDSSQGLVLATFQFEIIFHSFVSLPFSVSVCQSVCLCLSVSLPRAPAGWRATSSTLTDHVKGQRCSRPPVPCSQDSSRPDSRASTHGSLFRGDCLQ